MHTAKIKVCSLESFEANFQHFWISDLANLQERFTELQTPHKNDFYTILFVDNAVGVVQIDNQLVQLEDTKIVIIEPNCVNTIALKEKSLGKILCFSEEFFSLRYNNNMLNHFGFLEQEAKIITELSETQSVKFNSLLFFVQEEFSMRQTESQKVLRSYLNILLFEIDRLFSLEIKNKKTDVKQGKIQKFKKLIELHYQSNKLPSYYADILSVTPNYLNKLCKEETGNTAGDFIRKHILIESQRQLHFTNLSINEIADELGFESPSYFITFFKKQMGITPEQFRKEN